MKTTDDDKDARTLDILTHELGLLEMTDGRTTTDDRRWADDLAASMHARIAEYRRSRLPHNVPIQRAAPIAERLRAMSRAALEALLGTLVHELGPQAQFAHRKLDAYSDNDLRRLIQRIEANTTRR